MMVESQMVKYSCCLELQGDFCSGYEFYCNRVLSRFGVVHLGVLFMGVAAGTTSRYHIRLVPSPPVTRHFLIHFNSRRDPAPATILASFSYFILFAYFLHTPETWIILHLLSSSIALPLLQPHLVSPVGNPPPPFDVLFVRSSALDMIAAPCGGGSVPRRIVLSSD